MARVGRYRVAPCGELAFSLVWFRDGSSVPWSLTADYDGCKRIAGSKKSHLLIARTGFRRSYSYRCFPLLCLFLLSRNLFSCQILRYPFWIFGNRIPVGGRSSPVGADCRTRIPIDGFSNRRDHHAARSSGMPNSLHYFTVQIAALGFNQCIFHAPIEWPDHFSGSFFCNALA